jgi:protein SCO1/2
VTENHHRNTGAAPLTGLARPLGMTRLLGMVAAFLLLAGCASGAVPTRGSGFAGVVQRPPLHRPAFTLTDTTGARFDFAGRTRGTVTLLYFGYSNCPTECPTTLATVASALRGMPAPQREQVRLVLVTTDPARDTGPVLREYLHRFDPAFIGLTGTPRQVADAERVSSAQPSSKEPAKAGAPPGGGYLVAHTTWLYAYGTDDVARIVYGPNVSVADLRHDLPLLLDGRKPTAGTMLGLAQPARIPGAGR